MESVGIRGEHLLRARLDGIKDRAESYEKFRAVIDRHLHAEADRAIVHLSQVREKKPITDVELVGHL